MKFSCIQRVFVVSKSNKQAPEGAKTIGIAKSLLWFILFIVIIIAVAALVGIGCWLIDDFETSLWLHATNVSAELQCFSVFGVVLFAVLLPVIIFASHFDNQPWHVTLAIRIVPWKVLVLWMLMYLLLFALMLFLIQYFDIYVGESVSEVAVSNSILLVLVLGLISPVLEELVFRGYLFCAWRDTFLGLGGTLVTTSVLFAILHVAEYQGVMLFFIFGMSMIYGLARELTDSITTPVLLHVVHNMAATFTVKAGMIT